MTTNHSGFKQHLQSSLDQFLQQQEARFPSNEILRMDLHCHDHNSDVPDELLGRILKVPETWISTEAVMNTLKSNGCNAYTITNHNNARSCYELQDRGIDILTGAEFSCTVPDFEVGIHVLAYGFTPHQEEQMNRLRRDVYAFRTYTASEDIPTVWAHPLYHYSPKHIPGKAFFDKMLLLFERFEVINGQRDTWQNLLVKSWIESVTPEMIHRLEKETGLHSADYCKDPAVKYMTGGSDSHMGIFTGLSGSLLHIPGLEEKRKTRSLSELSLEAIKAGRTAPYGSHNTHEKLNIAFLDYFSQIALNFKDPGLLRLLMHKGSTQDKVIALLVSNAFSEIQHHKTTMRFIELFHNSLGGVQPSSLQRIMVSNSYKPVFDVASRMAIARKNNPKSIEPVFTQSIEEITRSLNQLLWKRTIKKFRKSPISQEMLSWTPNEFLEKFEVPSVLRSYFSEEKGMKDTNKEKKKGKKVTLQKMLDGLSFPVLASTLLLGANFTSLKVLYNARPMLDDFAEQLGKFKHPKRMLWLTDTLEDKNGVSMVLQTMLKYIQDNELPIDLLACSNTLASQPNLIIIPPLATFTIPFYQQQPIRIPSINTINHIFQQGDYDRVMASTELPMGLMALYLKQAYTIPAYFYMHTDWLTYGKTALNLDHLSLSRLRRGLRSYYKAFDKVFVLNTEHQQWLTSPEMALGSDKVALTAHWTPRHFTPSPVVDTKRENAFKILYAGRLSAEKGILELSSILKEVKIVRPDLEIIIAGTGPAESGLKSELPEARFLGWVSQEELPALYQSCDLLLLPSKFDTFSVAVLEAMSCGLPVVAYNTKGPKDIIEHGKSGYLADSMDGFGKAILTYINDSVARKTMPAAARTRAEQYSPEQIMTQLLADTGLTTNP